MAPLVYDPQAQKALAALWGEYRGIAQQYGLPFLATTPTRRANRERTCLLYTSDAADDRIIVDLGGRRIIKKKFF